MSARDDELDAAEPADEAPAAPTGSLEAEGIPEVEGPLPGRERGDDGDEGFVPPGDSPWAVDRDDLTAAEQREGSTLDERLAIEQPDAPSSAIERGLDFVDHDHPDDEPELVGSATAPGDGAPAEELAMHVTDDPPGATDDADDGYVGTDGAIEP